MIKVAFYILAFLVFSSKNSIAQIFDKKDSTFKKNELSIIKGRPIAKHVFGIFATNNNFPIQLQNPSLMLIQNASLGFTSLRTFDAIYLTYNLNFKKNFFLETGLTYVTIFHGYKTNNWLTWNGGRFFSFMSAYSALVSNFGLGYKIVTNTNKRLFDIQSGFSIGFTDNKVGSGNQVFDTFNYSDFNNNSGTVIINSNYKILNRTFGGLYFGISKEIKITENLYFAARYLSQYGFTSISEHNYQYTISGLGIESTVRGKITPRNRVLGLGLRWHFIK